jgi:hypothetical protein
MKKLNEGPTIQKNHKGNHLTNADGEIVQSFAKDRAGLKSARQSMYKNFKGLNVKTPEPEPQEEPVEEGNIHDDMALMKKQHNASVAAGNDPRLQHARGEKLWRQQHKANRGVDMPADAFNASDSRKVLDMDYNDTFGKFDWDKPVEFAKPDARALALNKQAKAARANFKSNKLPPLTQTQRDTYKQSRNAQTAQANKQRVANGMEPFPTESKGSNMKNIESRTPVEENIRDSQSPSLTDRNKLQRGIKAGMSPSKPVADEYGFYATKSDSGKFQLFFNDEVVGEYDTLDELKKAQEHVINKIAIPKDSDLPRYSVSVDASGKYVLKADDKVIGVYKNEKDLTMAASQHMNSVNEGEEQIQVEEDWWNPLSWFADDEEEKKEKNKKKRRPIYNPFGISGKTQNAICANPDLRAMNPKACESEDQTDKELIERFDMFSEPRFKKQKSAPKYDPVFDMEKLPDLKKKKASKSLSKDPGYDPVFDTETWLDTLPNTEDPEKEPVIIDPEKEKQKMTGDTDGPLFNRFKLLRQLCSDPRTKAMNKDACAETQEPDFNKWYFDNYPHRNTEGRERVEEDWWNPMTWIGNGKDRYPDMITLNPEESDIRADELEKEVHELARVKCQQTGDKESCARTKTPSYNKWYFDNFPHRNKHEDDKHHQLHHQTDDHQTEGKDMKINEGMTVNTTSSKDPNIQDTVTITADGEDSAELLQMINMAGIGSSTQEEIPSEDEGCGCDDKTDIDSMRDMIGNMDNMSIEVMPLEGDTVEEDLANAPDEKYADTDYMVNKLAGGINKPKVMYRQAADGDNPMSARSMPVTDLEESLMKEYRESIEEDTVDESCGKIVGGKRHGKKKKKKSKK